MSSVSAPLPSKSMLRDAISGVGPKVTSCTACTALIAQTGDELVCSGCKIAYYCDVDCQKNDWLERHNRLCTMFQNKEDFTRDELNLIADDPKFFRMMQMSAFEPYRPYFEAGTADNFYYDVIITKDPATKRPKLFSAKMRPRPDKENIHDCAKLEAEDNPHMARTMADPDLCALLIYLTSGTSTWPATFIASREYLTEMDVDHRWETKLANSLSRLQPAT